VTTYYVRFHGEEEWTEQPTHGSAMILARALADADPDGRTVLVIRRTGRLTQVVARLARGGAA
jgi:hypothetical protein